MAYQGPHSFEPEAPRQNAWGAIVRVITEPAATFRDFRGRVPVFPVYLVSMVLWLVGVGLTIPAVLKVVEQANLANPAMTPQLAAVSRISGIVGALLVALVGPWIGGLFVSLFALFYGQFQEERVSFPSYLGMVGYARIPLAIAQLVGGLLTLTLADKVKNFSLSLAVLVPDSAGAVLKALLGMFTPFTVWYYILLAIGFGVLHRGKASKGLGLGLTVFIILALLTVGLAALGSKLGSQFAPM